MTKTNQLTQRLPEAALKNLDECKKMMGHVTDSEAIAQAMQEWPTLQRAKEKLTKRADALEAALIMIVGALGLLAMAIGT